MSLYKITVKKTGSWGTVKYEKGMSVEVALQGATGSSTSVKKVKEAFIRKYGLDIKHLHGGTYLDYQKIN